MKRIIFTLSIIIFVGISCTDISLAPESQINEQNYYKTADDMKNAVFASYAFLRSNGMYDSGLIRVGEMRSDNTSTSWVPGNSFEIESFYTFQLTSSNRFIENIWEDHYTGIMRDNVVLDRIDPVEMSNSLKEQYKGEVRFLRALKYFNLVRIFGDVPLVVTQISPEEAADIERTSSEQVYQQIIDDLEFAEGVLPASYSPNNVGRATKGAAMGLLAKVYLTQHDYANARQKLEDVIDLDIYDLLPDYASLWDNSHPNSKESLFEVQYKQGPNGTGSGFASSFAPRFSAGYVTPGGGGGFNSPTADMAAAYEPNDLRKDISMSPGYTDGDGDFIAVRYVTKYTDYSDVGGSDDNWPVLRYADILLMYAEVLNEIGYEADGTAFDMLNMVRNRAGLPDKTSNNPDPALRVENQEELRLAVAQERRVELAFENHRWFDLVRTGRALTVMNSKRSIMDRPIPNEIQEYQLLFPIPLTVIQSSPNIKQNSGY